uniref:Uncharacterized protein n=1 Tax=Sphaerodactylus townsendi TaxID=933632 RepID=A0ACB8FRH9_9SAUR
MSPRATVPKGTTVSSAAGISLQASSKHRRGSGSVRTPFSLLWLQERQQAGNSDEDGRVSKRSAPAVAPAAVLAPRRHGLAGGPRGISQAPPPPENFLGQFQEESGCGREALFRCVFLQKKTNPAKD